MIESLDNFIIVEWGGGKRKLYKASCATCNCDRGYKKPAKLIGNCKSCQKKIDCGTLNIIKKCVICARTEVPNPNKNWHKGPTCCFCYAKTYRKNNSLKIKSTIHFWRLKNQIRHKASEKAWRLRNKEHKSIMSKRHRDKNILNYRIKTRLYIKNRCSYDINYKLCRILRHRLGQAIKNNQKSGSAVRDLGCSIEYFKSYIESKFEPGMTWGNHAPKGWHLDHKKPLSSYNLTDREEFLLACHYTNIQPMWWRDNIIKGDKYD